MKAEFLFTVAKMMTGDEPVIVEVEGYELEVYAIEYDEFEEVLRLKAAPVSDDEDDVPPWLENDDHECGGKGCGAPGCDQGNVCPIEPPQSEVVDIAGLELKEG